MPDWIHDNKRRISYSIWRQHSRSHAPKKRIEIEVETIQQIIFACQMPAQQQECLTFLVLLFSFAFAACSTVLTNLGHTQFKLFARKNFAMYAHNTQS